MKKNLLSVCLFTMLCCVAVLTPKAASAKELSCTIVDQDILNKGGDFQAGTPPKYTCVRLWVWMETMGASDEEIKAAINQIFKQTRKQHSPDAITMWVSASREAAKGREGFDIAMAEWWPKGHSLASSNETNIRDKNSYETTYNILERKEIPADSPLLRFTKSEREKIYWELYNAEERAWGEAEDKDYNIDERKLEKLKRKYTSQISKKYKLSKKEVLEFLAEFTPGF